MPAPALLHVAATAMAFLGLLSPSPDFYRIHKRRATGEVSELPVMAMFCSCSLWLTYGVLSHNIVPLVVCNTLGVTAACSFLAVFYRWATPERRVRVVTLCSVAGSIALLGVTYATAGKLGLIRQPLEQVQRWLGTACVAINMVQCVAPLERTGRVLATRSSASLPFTMSVVSFVGSSIWSVMAFLDGDSFVLMPNLLAMLLSAIQVGLCLRFPAREEIHLDGEDPIQVVVTSLSAVRPVDARTERIPIKSQPMCHSRQSYETFAEPARPLPVMVAA